MSIILVLGGARSGKSSFAEEMAKKLSDNVAYIATGQALDEEMEDRIAKHRLSRPANWTTYEEPMNVAHKFIQIKDKHKVFLLDCLTLFTSNILLKDLNFDKITPEIINQKEKKLVNELRELVTLAKSSEIDLIIVSNEVGLGLVPSNSISRAYRDMVGKANQFVANEANQVILVWAGIPLQLKPKLERI